MKSQKQATSFGLMAKEYQKYRRSYELKLYKLLFSVLDRSIDEKNLSILDIGCGTGKSTEPLITESGKRKVSVFGVDPDKAMLKEARLSAKKHKLPITYLQGSAERLRFSKEKFDAVISGAAFHWFGNKQAVKKIKSVLKKQGLFFIFWAQHIDTNKPAIGEEIYGRYKWQGIPQKFRGLPFVSKLLLSSGFKNVKTATIPFSEKQTIPQIIGLLKTNSSYALMSMNTKKDFVREMTKAHKDALGKKKHLVDKLELRICYGSKE